MANYEVLEPGGHAALVDGLKDYADRAGGTDAEQIADGSVNLDKLDEDVLDVLDTKADIDGYYAQLTAGAADNLTARGDAVEASFIRRTSGGTADIESGNATIKSIKGNTIRWNQRFSVANGNINSNQGTKAFDSSTGVWTITSSPTATNAFGFYTLGGATRGAIGGHKTLVRAKVKLSTAGTVSFGTDTARESFAVASGTFTTIGKTVSPASTTNIVCYTTGGEGLTMQVKEIESIDLTTMFGAGNEPETVAEFEAMYPEPYYAYDAGSLLPVTMTGIATDGFNQWDEQWEVGGYNASTGAKLSTSDRIRSKNAIPVFPSTEYFFKCTSNFNLFYYDADGSFISTQAVSTGTVGKAFTTPADAHELRFAVQPTYGTTYNNDICINLSWSGRMNGEYEPYWSAQRAIDIATYFPTGLKKAGTVYDELTSDEAIQRVGEVDLGTLTWTTSGNSIFAAQIATMADTATTDARLDGLVCSKYPVDTVLSVDANMTDKTIKHVSKLFYVRDTDYTDATTFKTAMSGVILYYALATPTTTAIDPPLNLTYKVDDWGTESVMVPSETVSAAPTFGIIYGMNAVDTIRRLPDLYAGKAETEAALAGKADVDGYYSQMTVGAADNLTGRGDTATAKFLYRTAGGTADIETGQAVAKSIKGNTLVWNQLYAAKTFTFNSTTEGLYTIVADGSGKWTVTINDGTRHDGANISAASIPSSTFKAGHKYLITTKNANITLFLKAYDTQANTIFTAAAAQFNNVAILFSNLAAGTYVLYPQLFDLTAMFGAGNEPSTVAEFEALFPEPYYEYDAGSLLSVNMEGVETVGFNQWDEEWEVGEISDQTGQSSPGTGRIRAKNFIPCFANTSYYLQSSLSTNDLRLYYYDADKGYIGHTGWLTNGVITTPAGCRYMRFATGGAYGGTYKGDICINLSWSGRRNGEYEAFWKAQRLIDVASYFPDGMRSAGSVYDELTSTEAIQRVGVVDLGTLTWAFPGGTTVGESGRVYSTSAPVGIKAPSGNNIKANITSSKYTVKPYFAANQGDDEYTSDYSIAIMGVGSPVGNVQIKDPSLVGKTAAEVKTAMSGVMLYYELATTTVTPIDQVLNLSYRVDDFGTERVMVPEDERSAPPVLSIAYGLNVVDFVRRAPSEYISHASMSQFRLALMSHFGIFINETWDEVDNRYEYTVTSE